MRQNIAYYLLLLYTTVMLKPLMPFVGDITSHFFAQAYHEATVHAKYGANHVDKEIADTGRENDTNKHQGTTRTEEPVPFHLSEKECQFAFSCNPASKSFDDFKGFYLPSILLSVQAPPPKLS